MVIIFFPRDQQTQLINNLNMKFNRFQKMGIPVYRQLLEVLKCLSRMVADLGLLSTSCDRHISTAVMIFDQYHKAQIHQTEIVDLKNAKFDIKPFLIH